MNTLYLLFFSFTCYIPLLIICMLSIIINKKLKEDKEKRNVLLKSSLINCLLLFINHIFLFIFIGEGIFFDKSILFSHLFFLIIYLFFVIFLFLHLITYFSFYYLLYIESKSIRKFVNSITTINVKCNLLIKKTDQALKDWNKDNSKYSKRLIIISPPVFCLAYMYMIFGVYEPFFANLTEWEFKFISILAPSIILFLLFLVFALIIPIFIKGNNLKIISIILSCICLLSYIQNMFLNGKMLLTGAELHFPVWKHVLNLIIWIGTILASVIVYFKLKFNIKMLKGYLYLSMFLLLIQIVPLPTLLIKGILNEKNMEDDYCYDIDGSEQFVIGDKDNIIVFIMDTFGDIYMDDLLKEYPEYYEFLADFIRFDNVNSETFYTPLSMPCILTGSDIDFSIPLLESNRNAWNSNEAENFYSLIHNKGYTVHLYSDNAPYCGGAENMVGKIDNIESYIIESKTKSFPTYLGLLKLSLFRYAPLCLKNTLCVFDTKYINQYTCSNAINDIYDLSSGWDMSDSAKDRGTLFYNADYYNELLKGINIKDNSSYLIFQHLNGMHPPYHKLVYENGVEVRTTQMDATKDCLEILFQYCNQLQKHNLYDDSLIILTADHGYNCFGFTDPVMLIKPTGYSNNTMLSNSAPVTVQSDILPTILDCANIKSDFSYKGISAFELNENELRERKFRELTSSNQFNKCYKVSSVGYSCFNYYREFHFTGDVSELDVNKSPYDSKPLTDFWW